MEVIFSDAEPSPPEWQEAKEELDKAVSELGQVSQGTTLQFTLPTQLLVVQLDIAIDMLSNQGLLNRKDFFNLVRAAVEALTSEVRRALLTAGAPTSNLIKLS